MKIIKVKIDPPTKLIAEAFGSKEEPVLLDGGQGDAYLSGNIVLKPVEIIEELNWQAEILNDLSKVSDIRLIKFIESIYGAYVYEGYVAYHFLDGSHVRGKYKEKLQVSNKFHNLLKDIKKPEFLDIPRNSWSIANWVALDKKEFNYDKEFLDLYNQIKPHLKSLNLPNQIVHGDLSGNFLFDDILPPAIIDFSPAWAPNGFAEAIMLADAIVWENAQPEELEVFKEIPNIEQLAWRGVLTRIVEQAEHIKWFGKDKVSAVKEAMEFQKAIDYLKENFN